MSQPNTQISDSLFQRPMPVSFTLLTKLKIEALETILQQPTSVVLEKAVLSFIEALPNGDRSLVQSLATRALESVQQSSQAEPNTKAIRVCNTVSGKQFRYRGSLEEGIETLFDNSQPLRITRENIDLIRQEIESRKGPALMGAIFAPLMPHSIGKAIQEKYRLSPINLSYVVPLLRERGLIRTFKESRNWYIEAIESTEPNP